MKKQLLFIIFNLLTCFLFQNSHASTYQNDSAAQEGIQRGWGGSSSQWPYVNCVGYLRLTVITADGAEQDLRVGATYLGNSYVLTAAHRLRENTIHKGEFSVDPNVSLLERSFLKSDGTDEDLSRLRALTTTVAPQSLQVHKTADLALLQLKRVPPAFQSATPLLEDPKTWTNGALVSYNPVTTSGGKPVDVSQFPGYELRDIVRHVAILGIRVAIIKNGEAHFLVSDMGAGSAPEDECFVPPAGAHRLCAMTKPGSSGSSFFVQMTEGIRLAGICKGKALLQTDDGQQQCVTLITPLYPYLKETRKGWDFTTPVAAPAPTCGEGEKILDIRTLLAILANSPLIQSRGGISHAQVLDLSDGQIMVHPGTEEGDEILAYVKAHPKATAAQVRRKFGILAIM